MTEPHPETIHASPRRLKWVIPALTFVVLAGVAWSRVGLLDLPSVPRSLTLGDAGLSDLSSQARLDDYLRAATTQSTTANDATSLGLSDKTVSAASAVRDGMRAVQRGDVLDGLERMREGIRLDPTNLVLTNAYRMVVFGLQREWLRAERERGSIMPQFPPHLDGEPIRFFEELDRKQSTRETKLNLALAWVDRMLLFPALEIKAPSSVEAVKLLTEIIDDGNPGYVPALFARGLNHLHRPARLVWPEADKTPPDAAARDIGLCVAIGRKFGVGSNRLQAALAMALGDAYVKAGRYDVARSWWQIAQNMSRDAAIQESIRRRYGWSDGEILDRLEEELDRARAELDDPMTDLALMWR